MQNDLISRKRLITAIKRQPCVMINGKQYIRLDAVLEKVRMSPTIDAVPVVRCRECKHSDPATTPDGTLYCVARDEYVRAECFCYNGEKMDGQDTNAPTKSDRGCSTCANDGFDMPQCRECTEHPGYPWYKRMDGGAEG